MPFDLLPADWAAFLAFCERLGYPNPSPDSDLCAALLATWRLWDQPASVPHRQENVGL